MCISVHSSLSIMFVRTILCSLWIVCGLSCCELLWVTAQWRRGRQTGRKWGGTNWKWGATNWWLADVDHQYDCWAHHQTIKKEVKASMKKRRIQIYCIEPVLVPASRRPQPILIRVPDSLELNRSSISLWFIAPKASAEGACILSKMGYWYGVWLVSVMKCGCKSCACWWRFLTVTLMMVWVLVYG